MSATQAPPQTQDLLYLPPDCPGDDGPPDPGTEARIKELVREFQADVAYARRHLEKDFHTNAGYLVGDQEQKDLPRHARDVLERYAVVDTLALHYRDRTNSTFKALLALAFLALLVLELFAHVLSEFFPLGAWPRLIFWLYPCLWLAAWGLWYYAHSRQYQKKYHDFRALAEGLRVQFFWDLLRPRLPDPVEAYYLRKQQGELEWIRRALRYWRGDRHVMAGPESQEPATPPLTDEKKLVRERWVEAQLNYFKKAGPREEGRGRRCKAWGAALFWASFGLAVLLGGYETWHVAQGPREPPREPDRGHGESVLVFAVAMLLSGAAIAVVYGEKMAFAEHARQYHGTAKVFRDARQNLAGGPLTAAEVEQLRALGREALQENGDWLLLHRDRPLEVIVP